MLRWPHSQSCTSAPRWLAAGVFCCAGGQVRQADRRRDDLGNVLALEHGHPERPGRRAFGHERSLQWLPGAVVED